MARAGRLRFRISGITKTANTATSNVIKLTNISLDILLSSIFQSCTLCCGILSILANFQSNIKLPAYGRGCVGSKFQNLGRRPTHYQSMILSFGEDLANKELF